MPTGDERGLALRVDVPEEIAELVADFLIESGAPGVVTGIDEVGVPSPPPGRAILEAHLPETRCDDARAELLAACTTDDVSMQDRFACVRGRDDLHGHIANTHVHLPGMTMSRVGEVRHCQGTVLVDWTAQDAQGAPRGKGTSVVRLHPDGRIAGVVGFW